MRVLVTGPASFPADDGIEIVERKGRGHPDTLANLVAESVSRAYARHCLDEFGVVLHHHTDKTALLGGRSTAGFGFGKVESPIRVVLSGRMSNRFGSSEIPTFEIARAAARDALAKAIPELAPDDHLVFRNEIAAGGGPPSKGSRWFSPASAADLPEATRLVANDTSCSVGFWPLTPLEDVVVETERLITGDQTRQRNIGVDVKIMAIRGPHDVVMRICVPFLGRRTPSFEAYRDQLDQLSMGITSVLATRLGDGLPVRVLVNAGDKPEREDFYVLAIGTALECGDEGVVGRGNRTHGCISVSRPSSAEAPWGKNPRHAPGKIYDLVCRNLAREFAEHFGGPCEVRVLAARGDPLGEPSEVIVALPDDASSIMDGVVEDRVRDALKKLDDVTRALIYDDSCLDG